MKFGMGLTIHRTKQKTALALSIMDNNHGTYHEGSI